jgi:hypothetical protein
MHIRDLNLDIAAAIFLVALFALVEIGRRYNHRCRERFGVVPLSKNAVVCWVVLIALIYYSDALRSLLAASENDVSNLLFLMGLGVAGAIASLVCNVWRTNTLYGMAGTALKFVGGLLLFLFAHYTVIGWFVLLGLLIARDHSPRPRCPLSGEAHWSNSRWDDPCWPNLYWDDPRRTE